MSSPSSPITSETSSSKNESNSDSNRTSSISSDNSNKVNLLQQQSNNKSVVISSSSGSSSNSSDSGKNDKKKRRRSRAPSGGLDSYQVDQMVNGGNRKQEADKSIPLPMKEVNVMQPLASSANPSVYGDNHVRRESRILNVDYRTGAAPSSSSSLRKAKVSQSVPNPRIPRTAEYTCYACDDTYSLSVVENSWWAVFRHQCPHCLKMQIPRIDINCTVNMIELDPNIIALYGESVDDSDDDSVSEQQQQKAANQIKKGAISRAPKKRFKLDRQNSFISDQSSRSEEQAQFPSTVCGDDDVHVDSIPHEPIVCGHYNKGRTCAESAFDLDNDEFETAWSEHPLDEMNPFGAEGLLQIDEASKLLVLMTHARTCSGVHESKKHADICNSTKLLMLHIRDCKGIDTSGKLCKFPWCLSCKSMLRHLTHCFDPETCRVCNPGSLPESFLQLQQINSSRNEAIIKWAEQHNK